MHVNIEGFYVASNNVISTLTEVYSFQEERKLFVIKDLCAT